MKTKIVLFFLLPALGLGLAWAQDGVAPSLVKGKVLLLASERCLEGDIEQVGDQYRVRRGTGETWMPVRQALRLCKDWQDALEYMKSRANLADADERLRLVRWCLLHNLREQALAEAERAMEIRPSDPQAKHWVDALRRSTIGAPASAVAPASGTTKNQQKPAQLDLNADSVITFTTRVQPILMNTCASCHLNGKGGAFQLTRAYEAGAKLAAQRNLAAVLAQINVEAPAASPFLVKAVSAHDPVTNTPPLASRQAIPFRIIQEWVEQMLAGNPHLKTNTSLVAQSAPPARLGQDTFAAAQPLPPLTPPAGLKNPAPSKTIDRIVENGPAVNYPTTPAPALLPATVQQAQPLTAGHSEDVCDPAEFNRLNHGK